MLLGHELPKLMSSTLLGLPLGICCMNVYFTTIRYVKVASTGSNHVIKTSRNTSRLRAHVIILCRFVCLFNM